MSQGAPEDESHLEVMDAEAWHIREVYAAFGVAVYFCQCVETQLVNYISMLRLVKGGRPMTEDEVDALHTRLFSNTFGRNLGEVRNLLGEDWAYAPEMAELLRLRNHLVHHWMRERITEMGTHKRRGALLEELEALRQRFEAADLHLRERGLVLYERLGIRRDQVQRHYERLVQESQADADGEPY